MINENILEIFMVFQHLLPGGYYMKTLKDIESLLTAHGLTGYYEKIVHAVRSSVRITLESASDERIAIGASKMGGLPDLPKTVD